MESSPASLIAAITSHSRFALWADIVQAVSARRVLEIGVFKGEFAEYVLRQCTMIDTYFMLDPWRHLDDWKKPANKPNEEFEAIYAQAMARTEFARNCVKVLRGTTTEVINTVEDASIDLAYIDGDHTLRGITIDLLRTFTKIRPGGILGGDDFRPDIWHHGANFEPTLVFQSAINFAEAVGCPIVALPFGQFAIVRDMSGFRLISPHKECRRSGLIETSRPL